MPKESSKQEARQLAMAKVANPNVNSVEIDIQPNKIEVSVGYYDGTTEVFKWFDA